MDDDEILFADDDPSEQVDDQGGQDVWTLMVVDDDEEVHSVTTLALGGLRFSGRPVRFVHAYSGAEAKTKLAEHPDTALMLLDVVMETDRAGLDVVEYVRNTLGNPFIRIILRTGQPGQAPEIDVITQYDINDYKHKTELTRERLFTTIYTSLGAYRDLITLEANRQGLEKVIEASATVMEIGSLERFAQGVLEQLTALMFLGRNALMLHASGLAANAESDRLVVLAGTGEFSKNCGHNAADVLSDDVVTMIRSRGDGVHLHGRQLIVTSHGPDGRADLIAFYVETAETPAAHNQRLIELFCRNVSIAWSRLHASRG